MAGNGFRAIGKVGQGYAGTITPFNIFKNYGTSIFYGDPVSLVASGTIERSDAVAEIDAGDVVGVFAGCEYVDANGDKKFSQHYPASQNVEGIVAYVVGSDPMTQYKVKWLNGSGVDITVDPDEAIGNCFDIDTTASALAGSTFTGNSTMGLDSTTATPGGGNFRVVALANDTDGPTAYAENKEYTHAIVIVNPGLHAFTNAAGI
jgi:hypothetical protein